LIIIFLLINNVFAQVSPKEHFGFSIGDDYQLTTNTQTEAYFKILASSERVKFVEIGKTEEGRSQNCSLYPPLKILGSSTITKKSHKN
jgi:thiamine monophosphate kinase